MTLKEFLNFKLIHSNGFSLTVYDIVISIVIIVVTLAVLKTIRRIVLRVSKNDAGKSSYWSIYLITRYLIWTIVVILLLDTVGVKISVLLASVTALLVGLGLGIQQLFNDVASGIVIILERNVQIGDVIELEDGTVGRVLDIGLRTSTLKTRDDIIWLVPNSKFVNDKVINWTHITEKNRFHVNVGVAYGSDVSKVKSILEACAKAHKQIANTPSPFVRFKDFGDSSLDFQLFFWVQEPFTVENTKSDLRFMIDAEFRTHEVKIPFPQRDVHFRTPVELNKK